MMSRTDYLRGFVDALEMVMIEVKRAKNLRDARRRIEAMLGMALEHKIEELARQLGYPLKIC